MIGSVFSGIGGLELGLERAGLGPVAFQVEIEPYCRHILERHWPGVLRYCDVRTATALPFVDVLCGGFPCQQLSAAGTKEGIGTREHPTARSGLWWEFDRIIGEIQSTWVVIENVAHTQKRWVPVVRRCLHERGYASVPIQLRASDVGARHERARIFLVALRYDADPDCELLRNIAEWAQEGDAAHLDVGRCPRNGRWHARTYRDGTSTHERPAAQVCAPDSAEHRRPTGRLVRQRCAGGANPASGAATDPGGEQRAERRRRPRVSQQGEGEPAPGGIGRDSAAVSPGFGLPPHPWMVRTLHGLPGGVHGPWAARKWTGARLREARIRGLGNAVVPQCSEQIGWLIARASALWGTNA